MNIAIMASDSKKELMVQFCTAYAGIFSKHTICATNGSGKMITEETGIPVHLFLSGGRGGIEQIGARITYNEIDMVLYFGNPKEEKSVAFSSYLSNLCDQSSIPYAGNVATAEMLVLGLDRGDLDWRDIVNPKNKPFTS